MLSSWQCPLFIHSEKTPQMTREVFSSVCVIIEASCVSGIYNIKRIYRMMTSKPHSSYKMQFAVRYPIPSCVQESKYHACPYLLIHSLNKRAFVPLQIYRELFYLQKQSCQKGLYQTDTSPPPMTPALRYRPHANRMGVYPNIRIFLLIQSPFIFYHHYSNYIHWIGLCNSHTKVYSVQLHPSFSVFNGGRFLDNDSAFLGQW